MIFGDTFFAMSTNVSKPGQGVDTTVSGSEINHLVCDPVIDSTANTLLEEGTVRFFLMIFTLPSL